MSRYETFDRGGIELKEVAVRGHDLTVDNCLPLERPSDAFDHPEFEKFVACVKAARQNNRPVIFMIGGHPVKLGLSRFLIDLMERGIVTHLATNGAGIIHDFELALFGGTSEDVAKWITEGQFGLWKETSWLNEIVRMGAEAGEGLGEAVGRRVEEERFPHRGVSLAAAGWRTRVPVTSHVSIGSDITHAHPNCDGAALGKVTYTDFLIFARGIQDLEGGVFVNLGSAVTGPEVYLKALTMARNVARQRGRLIHDFTTAVFDLIQLPETFRQQLPPKDDPQYYYRPWKTILSRTVRDGGASYYFAGDHRHTIPSMWSRFVSNDM